MTNSPSQELSEQAAEHAMAAKGHRVHTIEAMLAANGHPEAVEFIEQPNILREVRDIADRARRRERTERSTREGDPPSGN